MYVPPMPDASLRERRQALLERSDLRGIAFCRAYAAEADAWLSGLAEQASGADHRHLALLGGRRLRPGRACARTATSTSCWSTTATARTSAIADAIWYPVWDQGVHLDHSVRRPKEVLAMAADDLRVALGPPRRPPGLGGPRGGRAAVGGDRRSLASRRRARAGCPRCTGRWPSGTGPGARWPSCSSPT